MAIKYVSGKTRELRVGLSSYSEGKASLQVIGNVGVGTTNPLSAANPANTSVINAGIVTANKLFGDIVATGVGITNLNVTGISTFGGNVFVGTGATVGFGTSAFFPDNAGIYFGDEEDLIIFHDGNHSYIDDQGTGNLKLRSNNFRVSNADESKLSATFQAAGAAELYHNNNLRLTSTDSGVDVTNTLNVVGVSTFGGASSFVNDVSVSAAGTVGFGTTVFFNNDLRIESPLPTIHLTDTNHDSDWYIQNSDGTIVFYDVTTTNPRFEINPGTSRPFIKTNFTTDSIFEGETTLGGHGASPSHSLTVAGVSTFNSSVGINSHLNVTGVSTLGITTVTDLETQHLNVSGLSTFAQTILLKESSRVTLRDANASIYHQSNQLRLETSGTGGDIKLETNSSGGDSGDIILNGGASGDLLVAKGTGDVNITNGLNVGGISTFAGITTFVGVSTFNDDVNFIGDAAGITSAFWDKSANELKFYDGSKITLGDGSDLEIFHDGSNSYIKDVGTGDLNISGSIVRAQSSGGETLFRGVENGAVELYHNNLPRLETTGIGITIAGIGSTAYIEGPENIIIDPHPFGIGATSGNVFIRGDLYVEGTEFIVDVDKIELGDFQIGIATTAGTNVLLDGAGIGIGSTNIRKFITWNNATNALMTSENWNLASGKHYEIAGTDVLTSDTLLVGTGASVHSPSNNILTLHTNGAEKLRIDASGNLGIGTATPTDSANAANTSVTSAGIVTALEYYGVFKGSIPGFSTVFSSSSGQFSATPGTPQTIDTFAFATHDYQIAEYTLHFVHANGIQAQKALVMQNNSVAYSNEYGVMYDSELLVSIAATVSGGNVNITATPETGISGVTTFRWRREVQT